MKDNMLGKVVSVRNLVFSINETEILKDIDLDIEKGEFVGLIGPNGAGKTTLLKCLNGINRGKGQVTIKGNRLEAMGSKKVALEIALMHQNTNINFPFTALDIVLSGRYPHLGRAKVENSEDYTIARKYMEYTDTMQFEDRPITQISGGERQRVFFAKTLAQETDIILLDEPAASLDIAYEEQIFKYSLELCKAGKTVIAAVHDLKVAASYCSRLVLMKNGRILANGTPEEVLTTENLSKAYGVNALVYRNRITGNMDYFIHGMEHETIGRKVHVIGGGGSASAVIRLLYENGCKVTAGVFAHGDSDLNCAEIFGIECLVCQPFSEISDECYEKNVEMIRKSDFTILCDMPFGIQNMKNLVSAKYANKLIIIEDSDPKGRDFTDGKALEMYIELKRNAVVVPSVRLHEVL
jgi:ABC-type cobalamin/Fe3+-siderophores transport systems, ATPase components